MLYVNRLIRETQWEITLARLQELLSPQNLYEIGINRDIVMLQSSVVSDGKGHSLNITGGKEGV